MVETQVVITTYRAPHAEAKGLRVQSCHCGEHVWCLPYNESLARCQSYQRSPVKGIIDTHGMAPPEPTTCHHVILASPGDACLLGERKWRPMPTKVRTRHKVEKGGSRRGLPLQRLIMGREACTRFLNGYGSDVGRENLKRMTRKEIAQQRRAKKCAAHHRPDKATLPELSRTRTSVAGEKRSAAEWSSGG